ncbi:peptide/nickel transport system substrate-binding protein [Desulfacinum hydrothermale DSM 13146]|uniref:Peptide/nickel transport system substrate-binding protein n=1 Tax=Desulfacinum hydrothermale DSM 13146 TaxID=1121390 RepID=A0A1W1XF35_9BACT|nr:ABC transporter substrate-binding protein [Desulfacinum hydrothermale]SMC22529.1 peptide/nickel transport system substrate-binding protein [Desulfacinum hydrothermale DSM 13146]
MRQGKQQMLLACWVVFLTLMLAVAGPVGAERKPGAVVDAMKITTATATFDPVRPEAARVIAEAFKSIGWQVQANPIDYNQNVQKVMMEHDFDMWLVMLSGASLRIDPNVFLYKLHHSSEYKKGGWNWSGISVPELDKLVEEQQTTMDLEKRREVVFKAQALAHEVQALNVLAYAQMTNAYRSDRIKNVVPMMGEGIGSFWTDINMEVVQGDGYVRTGMTTPLKNLNPVAAKDHSEFMELRMIYDRLIRIGPDGEPKPWAAESFKIVDPTTIELTLRKGMKFHDGVEVTAEDVKFSLDYHNKWKAPFFVEGLRHMDSVEVLDKYNMRIHLKEPYAPFVPNLLGSIFIIPKHIWQDIPEKVGLDDPLKFPNDKPIGSGPFKFDYWDRGRELKVSAFKEHFSAPKCDGIIRIVYGSHDAMAAAIEKGECDRTRYILKPSLVEDLKKVKNVVAKGYPNHGFYTLIYHTRRAPLDDPAFRKAIAHVLPKELMIEAILSGYGEPGGSVISPVNKFWHNPEVKPFPNDIQKAKEILKAAGYTWDAQGRLHYPAK